MNACFGVSLRKNREKVGITQENLADSVGLDRTYISKLEGKSGNPSYLTIKKLCGGLGMSVGEFFKEDTMIEKKEKTFYSELKERFKETTGLQECPSLFELWMKGYQAGHEDCVREQTTVLDELTHMSTGSNECST